MASLPSDPIEPAGDTLGELGLELGAMGAALAHGWASTYQGGRLTGQQ